MPVLSYAESAQSAEVYCTISCKGELVVADKAITVTDVNKNGKLDIDDTLTIAHKQYYPGENGYESEVKDWGLSITKLWGDTSGWFMFYDNNQMVMSDLSYEVKTGDLLTAFTYSDQDEHSDKYTFFDQQNLVVKKGESVTLTMSASYWDENFSPVTTVYSGATVFCRNGEDTVNLGTTDEEGKITFPVNEEGIYEVSAIAADSDFIVKPICLINVYTEESVDAQAKTLMDGAVIKTTSTYNSATVSWTANKKASGYQISANGKNWTDLKKVTSKKYTGLKTGTSYRYYVRGYVTVADYTAYSPAKTVTVKPALTKAKLSSVTAGSKKFTAKWKKVSGANGYRVYYKVSGKKAKYKTVKSPKTLKTTVKKLSKNKKCTVKVQAYRNVDGKKVYGPWSTSKKVKIKK